MARYQLGLRLLVFFGHFGGITARAFALDTRDIFDEDRLGAERLDLFLRRRADIGGRDLRAQPLGGRDCLQARHAHTHHEDLGRLDSTGSGHHHRKGAAIDIGRSQHRLVAGEVRLAGQHIHALRAGDARHEFHRQRFEAALGIGCDQIAIAERVEGRRDPCAGFGPCERHDLGCLHTEHDIRFGDRLRPGEHFGPGVAIGLIGDGGGQTGALLHCDYSPESGKFLRRFGSQRDPVLARCALFQRRDA